MKTYTLVYQGGLANVFVDHDGQREKVLQYSFTVCEWFCLGLRQAGCKVQVAWCNETGDIATRCWNYNNFDEAPFAKEMNLLPLRLLLPRK